MSIPCYRSPGRRFAAINLDKGHDNPDYPKIREALAADDKQRIDFMKACLSKLGLKVNQDDAGVPSLSRLHLSSAQSSDISELISTWTDIITTENGEECIKAENDTFQLEKPSAWSVANLTKALPPAVQAILPGVSDSATAATTTETKEPASVPNDEADKIVDYDKIIKRIVAHESSLPESKETPYFNHHAFFANLRHYNSAFRNPAATFGKYLLYGEVVTSTNTLLEKSAFPFLFLQFPSSSLPTNPTTPNYPPN